MIALSTNQKTNKAFHDFDKPGVECRTKCDLLRRDFNVFGTLRDSIKFMLSNWNRPFRRDFFVPQIRWSVTLSHKRDYLERSARWRQRRAHKTGRGARATSACWWWEGRVRRARCVGCKLKGWHITRQDKADETNLGPGMSNSGKGTCWVVSEHSIARDLPDPVGDSSSAFLTGSWA